MKAEISSEGISLRYQRDRMQRCEEENKRKASMVLKSTRLLSLCPLFAIAPK